MAGSPHKVENQEACAKLTASKEGALFWTYRDSDKKCWIKTSKKGKTPLKTVVSGNRECGEEGGEGEEGGDEDAKEENEGEKLIFLSRVICLKYSCCRSSCN